MTEVLSHYPKVKLFVGGVSLCLGFAFHFAGLKLGLEKDWGRHLDNLGRGLKIAGLKLGLEKDWGRHLDNLGRGLKIAGVNLIIMWGAEEESGQFHAVGVASTLAVVLPILSDRIERCCLEKEEKQKIFTAQNVFQDLRTPFTQVLAVFVGQSVL